MGMQLTPTGLVSSDGTAVRDELAIYRTLALPWIPPELREDDHTITRAKAGVPRLVTRDDITGDLHMHTTWSDGAVSVRRMAEAAAALGHRYIAITDHSPSTGNSGGLTGGELRAQAEEIARARKHVPAVCILQGCEVDIRSDGSLDLNNDVLAGLDLVIASVHTGFDMTRSQMTRRIIKALQNSHVRILAHPTGRKLGQREGYPVDLAAVLQAASDLGVAVEANANPRRLDLGREGLWLCRELGVRVVINSDAHSVADLGNIRYGVDQARRGWLANEHIVNTGATEDVLAWLDRSRV